MAEIAPSRSWLRSTLAVSAGVVVVFVLSLGSDAALHALGVFPPWGEVMSGGLFALASAYRLVYAVAGGYVTARLAPDRPLRHALLLGVVGTVLSVLGLVAALQAGPAMGPLWYPVLLVVTALPCALAGGWLRSRGSA